MRLGHVNLSSGYRGGERQTELLVKYISILYPNVLQTVFIRSNELSDRLSGLDRVKVVHIKNQLAGHFSNLEVDVLHAHEAKAVHWCWLHNLFFDVPYIITRRVDTPIKNSWLNSKTYSKSAVCVAISNKIESLLKDRGFCNVRKIPSSLAHMEVNSMTKDGFRLKFNGKFIIGHAGALVDRHKGQRLIIEAAKRLNKKYKNLVFVFFGSGEDELTLKEETADIDNIFWCGFKKDIGSYISGLDIFVFPSRNEGLGSVLLDVMDLGIPIIASDAGGITDIVKNKETGLVFPNGDVDKFEQCLVEMISNDPLRENLANNAKTMINEFTPESMASRYYGLYKEVLSLDE